MKSTSEKVALAIAIVIIITVISAIVGGIVLISKLINHTKDSITADKFVSVMEDNGFEVTESKSRFLGIRLDKGYIAKKDEYQIEFYTFKDLDSAKEFFRLNKAKYDTDSAKTRVDLSGRNYSSFNIEADGKYKLLERVDKTVVCVNVDKEYKNDAKNMVDKLGY